MTALLVGLAGWPPELDAALRREGCRVERIPALDAVPPALAASTVRALFLLARPLPASERLLLQRCREVSPPTALVVVSVTSSQPDLQRAFEDGATAFLSWPASPEALRRALGSGALPVGSRA